MEPLWNDFQHVDDEALEEDHILKHLEEVTNEVIFGALHREMVVMLGPQSIIYFYGLNAFLEKDSLSSNNQNGLGTYISNEVGSLALNFSQEIHVLQFDFQEIIGTRLEESFMSRYPLCINEHTMFLVNRISNELILSIFYDQVIQFWLLTFDAYLITRLELHGWIYWKYD